MSICVVAHELGNVFEWETHRPLASAADVSAAALDDLERAGPMPAELPAGLALAGTLARDLIRHHGVDEGTYAAALDTWAEPKLVELVTLVGYFATVCWLMNVAHTPGPAG